MKSNTEQELPILFPDDECRTLYGNRSGFEILQKQVHFLLTESDGPVSLEIKTEGNFTELELISEPPKPESSWQDTLLGCSILTLILFIFVAGIFQIGQWLLSVFWY